MLWNFVYCVLFTVVDIDFYNFFLNYHDGRRDHESINGIPQGMKSYPKQFNRFPYYEDLWIAHMFDTMHQKECG